MNSVRQSCRPKHQVLILKCYPRFQKGVQEVKPNSSELSYLLYYASTRRSKLQKVGAFLEKRAARDVWRGKLGNVQVTLQILAALIEKIPRDLPLYARSVLTILDTILRSNDLSMVEETTATFDVFCQHQDMAVLSADQEYVNLYRDIVRNYASLASPDPPTSAKAALTPPLRLRWRQAGLQAIKSVVSSEALASDGVKQLVVVVPVILESLYSADDLLPLEEKALSSEKHEREQARRRRTSIATVQTVDTTDGDPVTAVGSAADADKLAEVEVRVLALRCLEKIFTTGSNRTQIRAATSLILQFIVNKRPPRHDYHENHPDSTNAGGSWATNLMEVIAKWAPVQDRFIILVTTMETLVSTPVVDDKLESQLILASMVHWLLSSPNTLIGLSVMDVLIGLLQHLLRLLQLGGRSLKMVHHRTSSGYVNTLPDVKEAVEEPTTETNGDGVQSGGSEARVVPWASRQELVELLQKCVGSLATHIYYADQVSDMIRTIVSRVKPSAVSEPTNTEAPADPTITAEGSSIPEETSSDAFFSFPAGRIVALRCIKNILLANLRKSMTAAGADSRNRVNIWVWEGTQWLLRDTDHEVRHAYVDAFLSWLQLETNKDDLRAAVEYKRQSKAGPRRDISDQPEKLSRRIISTASQRDKSAATATSSFLQFLHLVIYDNATESSAVESDILLLHLLLANLVENMGVNAAKYGLPMIMRLQDDFLSNNSSVSATARLNIASLVHGYLWALVEKFDLEATRVGDNVLGEISRRKKRGAWLDKIQLPPRQLNYMSPPGHAAKQASPPQDISVYARFSSLAELVGQIEIAYNTGAKSPAASPSASPTRAFSIPVLSQSYGSPAPGRIPAEEQLPTSTKEYMLASWSKEACLASLATEKARTSSLSGSRTGTSGTRNFLGANGYKNGNASPTGTEPTPANQLQQHHDGPVSGQYGLTGGLSGIQKLRRQSVPEGSQISIASSVRDSTVKVNELRRVLSVVNSSNVRQSSPLRGRPSISRGVESSASSESMVSDAFSASDAGTTGPTAGPSSNRPQSRRDVSETPKASGSHLNNGITSDDKDDMEPINREISNDIPPVPPLPATLIIPGGFPTDSATGSPLPSPSYSALGFDRPSTAPSQPRARQPTKRQSSSSIAPRQSRSLTRQKSRTGVNSNTSIPKQPDSPGYSHRHVHGHGTGAVRDDSTFSPGSPRSISLGRRVDVEKLLGGLLNPAEAEQAQNGGTAAEVDGVTQTQAPYLPLSPVKAKQKSSSHEDGGYYIGKKTQDPSRVASLGRMGGGARGGIARPPY
ncbi:plasma membrane localization protein [Emmonsiellopsis sp. PD_33]|nr:plasma membrane localization protein [Emmonsiellopsis sp. PD_33]